jgi:MYXO-CTERM domain-containing protein
MPGSHSTRLVSFAWSLAVAGAAVMHPAPALAQQWPADADWVVLYCGGVPSWDPPRDQAGAINERDVVGDSDQPALYIHADANHVFFRMRVSSDARTASGFSNFGWGVQMDTDGDPRTYQLMLMLNGNRDEVVLWRNTVHASLDDPRDPAEERVATYPAATHARGAPTEGDFASTFDGTADFFVDWAADWADLRAEGVTEATSVVMVMGTSSEGNRLGADIACHDGASGPPRITGAGTDPVNPEGDPAPRPDAGVSFALDPGLRGGGGPAGCACDVAGANPAPLTGALMLLGLAVLLTRRRHSRS